MAFGKKNSEEKKDEGAHDYLRFPMGTRITATSTGKLSISFAGDVSIGESLPELGELSAGRNLSFDPGVTLKSDRIEVKNELEISPGCKINTEEIKAEKVVCKRSTIETKTIETINLEAESTNIVADKLTVRENVYIDKGDLEIGTVIAQMLTLTKGTEAHIMIAEVNKLEGSIQKGGYESFNQFLSKLYMYRPDVLNDEFASQAKKLLNIKEDSEPKESAAAKTQKTGQKEAPTFDGDLPDDLSAEPIQATGKKLKEQLDFFKKFYTNSEMPKEIKELCGYIETNDMTSLKKNLNPCYQKLAVHKIPNEVMEIFYNIQRILKEDSKMRKEQQSK
ncbi:hypothetical protein ACFLU6_00260 [Acidobacteriota bacterium]